MSNTLWEASSNKVEATEIFALSKDLGLDGGYDELHAWSIEDSSRFWRTVWDRYGVIGERTDEIIRSGSRFRETRFFPDASLNVAENLLTAKTVNPATHIALTFSNETGAVSSHTLLELQQRVSVLQQAMRRAGVGAGDVVAAWLPNIPETMAIFLAANSIGAVFTSSSPDFGTNGVVDRFGQLDPKLFFATDAYLYANKTHSTLDRLSEIAARLPTVEQTVLVPYLNGDAHIADTTTLADFTSGLDSKALEFERLDADHPIFVLFSSGTTGTPKAIVHRSGGVLLKLISEHRTHCDIHAGDRVFYFTTAGWMMWNWLAMVLQAEATAVLFDGSPFHPGPEVLWEMAERERTTLFGISAKYVDALNKAKFHPADTYDLSSMRTICSTGSTLVHESFRFLYEHVKADVHVASMSGGTDLCGCLVGGNPTAPVIAGEIQCPAIGLDIAVFDADGSRLPVGEQGELVCLTPFPSIPLRFVGDDGHTRFDASYFDRFDGVWHQGDFAEWSDGGGMIISGRSDATLNPGGVRIGTAEIYRQVEQLAEIEEGLVIGQSWDNDTRIVLFVRLAQGATLDDQLVAAIKVAIRDGASPRHVPAKVLEVADIPRTRSGKISELAVRDIVEGRQVKNTEALANPEALELYRNRAELQS
ncbi:MAG: acetoacetyl-CoA synthetase [Verrucomicrobiales bacterium]|jgi:acetoacetyl-CoA synthetase